MNLLKITFLVLIAGPTAFAATPLPNREFELKSVSCPETNTVPEKIPTWNIIFSGSKYNDRYSDSKHCHRTGGTYHVENDMITISMTSSQVCNGATTHGRATFTNPIQDITKRSFSVTRRDQICNGLTRYNFAVVQPRD